MILSLFLLQTGAANLLLGFMPESIGLLIFGVVLVGSTVFIRRVLSNFEEVGEADDKLKEAMKKLK